MVIDLEFAYVGYAVNDLSYVFSQTNFSLEYKRLFIRSYLNALGVSDTENDVDELIFLTQNVRDFVSFGPV